MIAMLLGFSLSLALVSSGVVLRSGARYADLHRGLPVLTLVCVLTVTTFTLAQFAFPHLLPALMRDRALVLSGQPWRLATSLLVQDGGYADALFNVGGLLVAGVMTERLLGPARWALIAVSSIAVAQGAALAWQPLGAGNSILNFALAGSLVPWAMKCRTRAATVPATAALAGFAALLCLHDIHGAAAAAGVLVALVLALHERRHGDRRGAS